MASKLTLRQAISESKKILRKNDLDAYIERTDPGHVELSAPEEWAEDVERVLPRIDKVMDRAGWTRDPADVGVGLGSVEYYWHDAWDGVR